MLASNVRVVSTKRTSTCVSFEVTMYCKQRSWDVSWAEEDDEFSCSFPGKLSGQMGLTNGKITAIEDALLWLFCCLGFLHILDGVFMSSGTSPILRNLDGIADPDLMMLDPLQKTRVKHLGFTYLSYVPEGGGAGIGHAIGRDMCCRYVLGLGSQLCALFSAPLSVAFWLGSSNLEPRNDGLRPRKYIFDSSIKAQGSPLCFRMVPAQRFREYGLVFTEAWITDSCQCSGVDGLVRFSSQVE
ncbi:hypothetical protein AHAS_Ahas15G0145200 [Arachis hypogaea]